LLGSTLFFYSLQAVFVLGLYSVGITRYTSSKETTEQNMTAGVTLDTSQKPFHYVAEAMHSKRKLAPLLTNSASFAEKRSFY